MPCKGKKKPPWKKGRKRIKTSIGEFDYDEENSHPDLGIIAMESITKREIKRKGNNGI